MLLRVVITQPGAGVAVDPGLEEGELHSRMDIAWQRTSRVCDGIDMSYSIVPLISATLIHHGSTSITLGVTIY